MAAGYGSLPANSHRWREPGWMRYHSGRAEAIGCTYDKARADKVVAFASMLKHTKGRWAGQQFEFLPWFEHQVIRPFYGYIDTDGFRRYRRAYVFVAKKNAKTTSTAPLVLYHLHGDGEEGAECYSAAADRDQAALVYGAAAPMNRDQQTLDARSKVLDAQKRIVVPSTNSFYQVLSAEVESKHGINPSMEHFDELHAQPNRHLWDVLTMGTFAARQQPALFVTSTAGWDRNSICHEEWGYARRVRDDWTLDPRLLPVIYEVPEDADWKDESLWHLANPSLGCTIEMSDLRDEFKKALEVPANENAFRRLRLNQWVSQETRFMPMHAWDSCAPLPAAFAGRRWFGGLDLSSTTDLTAWGRVSFDGDACDIDAHGWIPGENIEDRERRDKVPYREWARLGFLTICPGPIIDYGFVKNRIDEDAKRDGKPVEIGFDPYNARQFCEVELPAMGFEMFAVPQNPSTMTFPTKKLLELVVSGKMRGSANPLLRWSAENMVVKTDSNGNLKPDKGKTASQRIDPVVAVIDALERATRNGEDRKSVYEERGLLVL